MLISNAQRTALQEDLSSSSLSSIVVCDDPVLAALARDAELRPLEFNDAVDASRAAVDVVVNAIRAHGCDNIDVFFCFLESTSMQRCGANGGKVESQADAARTTSSSRHALVQVSFGCRRRRRRRSHCRAINSNAACDMSDDVVQRCRGVIVDTRQHRVVCLPYDKFFNLGDANADAQFDWSSAVLTEKVRCYFACVSFRSMFSSCVCTARRSVGKVISLRQSVACRVNVDG